MSTLENFPPDAPPEMVARGVESAIETLPDYPGTFRKRGIAICIDGAQSFLNAFVTVRMLRHFGNDLPIELWHNGAEEIDATMRKQIACYGAECIDASRGRPGAPPIRSRLLHAILHCRFREVLALAPANLPIRDPAYLFEYPEFAIAGALFWLGRRNTTPQKNPIWRVMETPYRNEPGLDTAQILINKEECWEPLALAAWMEQHGNYFGKLFHLDADIFRFAWNKFGRSFALPLAAPQELPLGDGCCPRSLVFQHDLDGERLFQNRSQSPWRFFGNNPYLPGYSFEGECREFLRDLQQRWNGRVTMANSVPLAVNALRPKLTRHPWKIEIEVAPGTPTYEKAGPRKMPGDCDETVKDIWPSARDCHWIALHFKEDGTFGDDSTEFYTFWELTDSTPSHLKLFAADRTLSLELSFDEFLGEWVQQQGNRQSISMKPMRLVGDRAQSAKGVESNDALAQEMRKRFGTALHLYNSSHGIGDHLTSLYACAAAADTGMDVIFHTRHPAWMTRISHERLQITGELPPLHEKGMKPENVINLHDYSTQQFGSAASRARWYCSFIHPQLTPVRPAAIDRRLKMPRFDFQRYAVIAPCSANEWRNWPAIHWRRLILHLREAGLEVVAVGTAKQEAFIAAICAGTTAYWVVDHSAEWLSDAMLGASVVVANDSAIAHFGGLLDVPTIAIHSLFGPEILWDCTNVKSALPKTNCAFCQSMPQKGFDPVCNEGCSALYSITPDEVMKIVRELHACSFWQRPR